MAASDILPRAEVDRLAKLLRLLGSDSPGERSAAAWKCHEFVTSRGLEWIDIIDPPDLPPPVVSVSVGHKSAFDPTGFRTPAWNPPPSPPPPPPQQSGAFPSWRQALDAIQLYHSGKITKSSEAQFIVDLQRRSQPALTLKQEVWLRDICQRFNIDFPMSPGTMATTPF